MKTAISPRLLFAFFVLSGALGGCHSKAPPPEPPPPPKLTVMPPAPEDPAVEARQLFRDRCSTCHGQTGHGDGPSSAALAPKPRAFADANWQSTVSDEHLRQIIVKGGAAMHLSPGMPPNPNLESKPAVVDELVKLVRGFNS